MQINNKTVAIITGGGSGLGEATARRLYADGAAVVLLDLPQSKGAELAAELGDRARFAATDVRIALPASEVNCPSAPRWYLTSPVPIVCVMSTRPSNSRKICP